MAIEKVEVKTAPVKTVNVKTEDIVTDIVSEFTVDVTTGQETQTIKYLNGDKVVKVETKLV